MKDDEQAVTGSRRPWVTPAMVEEDCAATESGSSNIQFDGTNYDSGGG